MIRSKPFMLKTLALTTISATVLPTIGVYATDFTLTYSQFTYLIGVLGVAHVGMTAFFFLGDRRYASIIASAPLRFIALPAALTCVAFAVFSRYPNGIWPYFAIHYAWLLWHFGRQNFGLYAFAAGGPIGAIERAYFNLLPLAAIPKALAIYPQVGLGAYAPWASTLSTIIAITCAGLGVFIAPIVTPVRQIGLVLGFLFFAPTLLSSNPAIALTFYAHPLQYIIMMLYLAGDSKQGAIALRLTILLFTGFAFWGILTYLTGVGSLAFLALTYGITQAHFVIDAGIWKLKHSAQRVAILASFDFLFEKETS